MITMDNMIMEILAFIVAMIPVITVIMKLNTSITKLNVTIDVLSKQMENSANDRKSIHNQLNNHETRITVLEKKGRK